MSDIPSKSIRFSNSKSSPWWHPSFAFMAGVTALAATLLGGWIYVVSTSQTVNAKGVVEPSQTLDAVQRVLSAGKPTIIEFGANNCVSCREMKPILHALLQDTRIAVADVDILKERSYISKYQIRLMPTQVFYNARGEEIGRHMGKISAQDILAQLGLAPSNATTGAALPKALL